MAAKLTLPIRFLLLLLFNFEFRLSVCGPTNTMESVPDLVSSMYSVVEGFPCVRLLNLSGEIGCANPGRDKVVAPIVRYKKANDLPHPSAILVSSNELQDLFDRISNDARFSRNIAGILVESETDIRNKLRGFSPAKKFPESEFSPYQSISYEWNPSGSGIMWEAYDFPVFLLSEASTQFMQEVSVKNVRKSNDYVADVVEFDSVMQTTKSGTRDSESCLKEETCLPLGGYSVWSSLPSIDNAPSKEHKPIILTVASLDSASFFRDRSIGAESPISGLIALLAAVDSLSRMDGLDHLSKQLIFSVFTGEAWGYLGSRRFLLELDLQSDAVNGLDSTLLEMVVEIGSVGKAFAGGNRTFFAHTTTGVSSAINETMNALKHAQHSLKSENITISLADTSNPGIPPSSLMAFLKKNASTSGIVLEDFDTAFVNKFYHSHLDDMSNVNSSSIVAAASLVARTLYILASENKNLSSTALSAINVNASLVEELVTCLLECNPGLSCDLVTKYISPASRCPNHYVGVILGEPSQPSYVNDVSRFLWNFLADKTSSPRENIASNCSGSCSNKSEVCIKSEVNGTGVCVVSTTRYVPAYSTRLKYESGAWNVLPPNSSDLLGMVDPVWTESNWDTIGLRVYTVQDVAFDRLVLLAGLAVTVVAYLAILIVRAFITKALKRD